LQASQTELLRAKSDRLTIVAEHGKLATEIERLVQQSEDDRQSASARFAIASADAHTNTLEAIRRVEARLRGEQKLQAAKSEAAAEALRWEIDRLTELSGRLRLERDAARADSLRFNAERNDLRKEVASLLKERSEQIVKAAAAARVKFPGSGPQQ
jgi:metal-dependent amidase/aminoacylase/carboxypeptidase family protein